MNLNIKNDENTSDNYVSFWWLFLNYRKAKNKLTNL